MTKDIQTILMIWILIILAALALETATSDVEIEPRSSRVSLFALTNNIFKLVERGGSDEQIYNKGSK
tara:strand:- start:1833 stop:2033 length:201 start_codon:yes stop_codon:yes gene_type:complete